MNKLLYTHTHIYICIYNIDKYMYIHVSAPRTSSRSRGTAAKTLRPIYEMFIHNHKPVYAHYYIYIDAPRTSSRSCRRSM